MPVSHHEGRDWVAERLKAARPDRVIDVGPGEGIYSMLMRHLTPGSEWWAVEVWAPYVERFDLASKYDEVRVADVRDFAFPGGGAVLLGDVVEHLPEGDGRRLLTRLMQRADHLMVSVPIVPLSQGAFHGNPHERHLTHWSFEDMDALMGHCDSFRGEVLGRWWWSA